jgi:glyoxylase-like metal-dependent hydrolase (beta-lactamase superfamily II)
MRSLDARAGIVLLRGLAARAGLALSIACCVLGFTTQSSARGNDPLAAAAQLLGADAVRTLRVSGSGATFTVGQDFAPTDPWPRVTLTHYTMSIDFGAGNLQQDLTRTMGATMPRGGGVPFFGELRQIQGLDRGLAWNAPDDPDPSAASLPVAPCTPPEDGGTPPKTAAAPDSEVPCSLMLWATPQGFLKAAQANGATVTSTAGGTEVSFLIRGTHRMIGVLNAQHQVERVRTWISQSIVGAMLVDTEYSAYKDFGGVWFPSRIVQKADGFPSLDLTVASVVTNAPVTITAPAGLADASPPPRIVVQPRKLADGVFWLTGGSHHSLAIEMKDHIVLVDTPNGEARALAVIAKAKELIPGKPVRFVIAMHHHWDHMGGIPTAIAEGATIVTHGSNRLLLERAATAPHTIQPDRLAGSHRRLELQAVGDEGQLTDGLRTIELHRMTGFDHTDDMLLVYLPKERILAEADAYTPPETPTTPLIAPKVPYAAALYENIRRLKLDVGTIAPFHGLRTADMAEVAWQAHHGMPDGTTGRRGFRKPVGMNDDGSAVTRGTTHGAWDGAPAWSPARRRR